MCTLSQEECHDPAIISAGFKIDRSISNLHFPAAMLMDPDTEQVLASSCDYSVHQGITGIPITEADGTKIIHMYHAKMLCFDFIVNKLMVCQNSHQKWYSPATPVQYSSEDERLEKEEQARLNSTILAELDINIGNGKDLVIENKFSTDAAWSFLAELSHDEAVRGPLKQVHLLLCAIIHVMNSQHQEINIQRYQEISTQANTLLCKVFPWAIVPTSILRVLALKVVQHLQEPGRPQPWITSQIPSTIFDSTLVTCWQLWIGKRKLK